MNTSTITFLLVTLFSTGVLVADAATPEAAVVGQDSAELAAADGSELSGQALPKNEDKKETEQPLEGKQPEIPQGALQKLQAAGTWVKEELIPGNERERRMMALGGAVAAVIAAILHSRSTR